MTVLRKTGLLMALLLVATTVAAQSDVSKYYLANYGFDTNFDYPATSDATVAQEILQIDGWTPEIDVDYTITGVYEFGFQGTFNNATVPAQGYDGEAGGALALSTGWEKKFLFYQTVTLPAGTYTIKVPTYNGFTATGGTSELAWIPNSGTAVKSTTASYPAKAWTLDQITFTLTATTTGKIQIGYQAVGEGSGNSANLLIDYVQLLGQNMSVDKTALKATIDEANTAYGSGTGVGASTLKTAISQAQTVYNKAAATMPDVLEANYELAQVLENYRKQNASASNPVDYSSFIINPSFETDPSGDWTVNSMQRQSNNVFSIKAGTYYLESWVAIGQQLGNHGVSQTLKKLPQGNYRLSVAALHIQQSGNGSITNSGADQTGVYLFAGTARQTIAAMNTYTLNFSVIDEQSNVDIGLVAEDATGNYLCVDNFKLEYIGQISADSYKNELNNLLVQAQELLDIGLQSSVATSLQQAMTAARSALSSSNQTTLATAHSSLLAALEAARASRALYDALEARLDYAKKVLGWWEGESSRALAWTQLQTAVATATTQLANYSLSDTQLKSAVSTLNASISAVDKSIYCSGNACGSDTELQNPDSYWSYERSLQSKHWILFWENGYGTAVPSAVPGILDNADKIFEYYANDLGYITINQGKSKTDTYKMIIRLRHTTTWEAAGSGIDNVIGLLTLSNGAHTSRSGQTVAHEIGHCFQYQTHCDNGDWNGWMYNWGASTLNVFWEMCAQWQAYKFYPTMQFVWDSNQGNDWFGGTINGMHRHPLCVDLRYNNYFIQDYMCHKQGDMKFLGRLWNESKSPEDPFQAYMRLTMTGTNDQKISKLGDEMWEYGARMTTFDIDPIRNYGSWRIGFRNQTSLTKDGDDYWWPTQANCIENFGNNAIRVNAPATAKTIYVDFEGMAGADGYNAYNTENAGWRLGFVAYKSDGTRIYGDMASASYASPKKTVSFDCPAGCDYVWLVVSGAPTNYWTRDWLSWSEESDVEQWPYRVKFHKTNVYGEANNDSDPEDIDEDPNETNPAYGQNVFDVTNAMAPWLSTASLGEWTNNGFKLGPDGASYTGAGEARVSSPFIENWAQTGLGDAAVEQTVRELPNGTYYIGGSFIATDQNNANTEVSGVEFYAGDQTVSVATANKVPRLYSLRVEVTDGTLTFGFRTRSTTANWVAMDNLFLYWAGEAEDYYAKATASVPVRIPIANPRMEDGSVNNFIGWTLTNTDHNWDSDASRQSWNGFDGPAMASWRPIAEGGLSNMTALQNVTLPEGYFKLQATLLASTNPESGVSLVLGPCSANCSTPSETTATFATPTTKLQEGSYTLGLKVENTTANWVMWDNVVLYLYGADIAEAYWESLQAAKNAQQSNEPKRNGAASMAIAQYEWTAEELATKSESEVSAAIAVLNNGALISNNQQNATGLVGNADFGGGVESLDVQGSGGRVEYPSGWNFDRSYEGWNDTFVDKENGIFNAWAGVITLAELYQTISSLPNGTYRLTADVRVDQPAETAETALYGKGENDVLYSNIGADVAGGDVFATYSLMFDVADNEATIGILSHSSFFQIKNIKLEFVPRLVGDINRDGVITIADAKVLVNIILGTETDRVRYDFEAADVNGDGTVTIADLTALVNRILKN